MKKRMVSLLVCGALTLGAVSGLAACGDDDTVKLTLWGPAAQQTMLKEMAEKFKAANPDTKYNITVGVCGEGDAYMNVSKDPSASADVYGYSNDQLVNLLRVGAVAQIGGSYLETIKAENSAESVAAGTFDGKVYGYPYASDNGYFMFYDKSVLTEDQVGSLETIISVCEAKNKQIGWAIDDAWYSAGWFFGFGCSYSVTYKTDSKYTEDNIDIDFDSANGIKASKAIASLTSSEIFAGKGTTNDTIISKFGTGQMAVAVSGTWNAKDIQAKLGDNYGVCKLPTVKDPDTGEAVQLGSFRGYKLFAANPHSKNLAEAHRLAAFLSSEAMQKERFEKHSVGPTNKNIAALEEVTTDITLAALIEQNKYSVEQSSVPSNFWNPLKTYGTWIIDGLASVDGSNDGVTFEKGLSDMVEQIKTSI